MTFVLLNISLYQYYFMFSLRLSKSSFFPQSLWNVYWLSFDHVWQPHSFCWLKENYSKVKTIIPGKLLQSSMLAGSKHSLPTVTKRAYIFTSSKWWFPLVKMSLKCILISDVLSYWQTFRCSLIDDCWNDILPIVRADCNLVCCYAQEFLWIYTFSWRIQCCLLC